MMLGRVVALSAVAVLATVTVAPAQTLSEDILQDWQRMKQIMMGIADAMPEETFDYASTPEQRTFGEQILHVAGGNVMLMGFLGAEASGPSVDRRNLRTFGYTVTSKADILEALSASFDYGEAALREFDDTSLMERVEPTSRKAGGNHRCPTQPRTHVSSSFMAWVPNPQQKTSTPFTKKPSSKTCASTMDLSPPIWNRTAHSSCPPTEPTPFQTTSKIPRNPSKNSPLP